ncbi:hypothetical protein [Aquimarina algiphila]|uniref:hypothetical protein n=1 Tax=Aquimarina algiphila TaxID=2047982 RepID=UPI002490B4C0|nr:hypothetical protein [Aquimarina algiphila]
MEEKPKKKQSFSFKKLSEDEINEKVIVYLVSIYEIYISSPENNVYRISLFIATKDPEYLFGKKDDHFEMDGTRNIHIGGLEDMKFVERLESKKFVKSLNKKFIDLLKENIKLIGRRNFIAGQTKTLIDIEGLNEEIENLKNRLKMNKKKKRNKAVILYIGLLLLSIIIVTVILYNYKDNTNIQVSIEYNIGEIIGGILVGAGIGAAGIAYATKTIDEMDNDN